MTPPPPVLPLPGTRARARRFLAVEPRVLGYLHRILMETYVRRVEASVRKGVRS